jgi:hypothetical protein
MLSISTNLDDGSEAALRAATETRGQQRGVPFGQELLEHVLAVALVQSATGWHRALSRIQTGRISRGMDTELTLHIASGSSLNAGPPVVVTLKLPTGSPSWRIEFVTLGLLLAGAHSVQVSGYGRTPKVVNLTAAVTSCTAAGLAEWLVRRKGSGAAPAAALAGFGPSLLAAIWGTRRMRAPRTPDGVAIYPGVWAFTGISYVLGFYAGRMTPTLKGSLAAGVGIQLAGSWLIALC